MKLTLVEIDKQLDEIREAQDGLDAAIDLLLLERTEILNHLKSNPVQIAVVKSLNGSGV